MLLQMPVQDAKTEITRIIGLSGGEVSVVYRQASGPGDEILINPDVVYLSLIHI